jgi:hypothetical protein
MVSDTRSIQAEIDPEGEALPTWLRPVVYGFLVAVLVCGLFSIEAWPLTGFRLYSDVRPETRYTHEIVAELADGTERVVDLDRFPLGYHNTNLWIRGFDHYSPAKREEICAGWVVPLEEDGLDVVAVRVDTLVTHLSEPDVPSATVGTPYRCEL